jgi:hypothetical protein
VSDPIDDYEKVSIYLLDPERRGEAFYRLLDSPPRFERERERRGLR